MKFSNGCWLNKEGVTSHSPAEVYDYKYENNTLTLYAPCQNIRHRGDTLAGPLLTIELSSPMEHIIKVKIMHFTGVLNPGPHFALDTAEVTPEFEDLEDSLVFRSGNLSAQLQKGDQWKMDFAHMDFPLTHTGSRNIAYLDVEGEGKYMREQLHLSVGENIYGLGERFTPWIKNGQTVDVWNEDGGTSTEQSYKNIPFFLSNKGYGVFVNHPEKVSFEIGSEKVTKTQFSVPGESLEYYIIDGPNPKDIVSRYTALTGRPALPPAWSFGLWLTTSFTTDYDEATVMSFIDGMFERNIPLHTFHFDCFWMKGFHWCDFIWDRDVFPDPEGMLSRLKEKGLKICVWINPYIAQQSPLFNEGRDNGYFIKNKDGSVWQWDLWQPGMAIVDFTNPDACAWYTSHLRRLIHMGVDAFKTDFGERIPTDVTYYNGSDPMRMHNYYTYLYNEVVFDLLKEELGEKEAVLFARSATVGGQKFPVHWGGDCTSEFESMAESLRGGLSLTTSGFGFWSHDIGGFESTSTPDVYKRWAAFGLLSTHSRLHGSSSYRVPWAYDEESVDVVRYFTQLKCQMMPYLFTQAAQTAATGIPMMRSMMMEFPNDPTAGYLDRQYMLGDDILVAPVLDARGDVTYYLPEGTWTNFITNERVEGGRFVTENHGYLSLPCMVKDGSVIALGGNMQDVVYDYHNDTTYHIFPMANHAQIVTRILSSDQTVESVLTTSKESDTLKLKREGVKASYSVLLRLVYDAECSDVTMTKTPEGLLLQVPSSLDTISIRLL